MAKSSCKGGLEIYFFNQMCNRFTLQLLRNKGKINAQSQLEVPISDEMKKSVTSKSLIILFLIILVQTKFFQSSLQKF